eukprot:719785-Rhodomonas_salina.2
MFSAARSGGQSAEEVMRTAPKQDERYDAVLRGSQVQQSSARLILCCNFSQEGLKGSLTEDCRTGALPALRRRAGAVLNASTPDL